MTEYVVINRKKFKVKRGRLKINYKMIHDITEIKGLKDLKFIKTVNLDSNLYITEIKHLENLKDLTALYLSKNNISEIKGLDTLTELKFLDLSNNNISEIKGLNNLENLEELNLSGNKIMALKGLGNLNKLKKLNIGKNKISHKIINDLGGLNSKGWAKFPLNFVKYCKNQIVEKRTEIENKVKKKEEESIIKTCPFCGIVLEVKDLKENGIKCTNCGETILKDEIVKSNLT